MVPFVFLLATACLLPTLDARVVKRQTGECPDQCKNVPLEISFVVDSSNSIWRENFTLGLWFVQNFVDKFDIGPDQVRVSMVTYGDGVYPQHSFGFNAHLDKAELNTAIDTVDHEKGRATDTGIAIDWFLDNQLPQARPGVRHVLIVLTDGNSQEPGLTKAAARRALTAGLDIFAIGVGHEIDDQELHNIASDGRHVFFVSTYGMLDDILLRLAYETCNVGPEPPCQFDPVDLVLVIDSSVSIGQSNFSLGLKFIKEFLEPFTINPSSIRVAALMFGDRVYNENVIPFDMYRNKKDTQDAILRLPWMKGHRTETGMGIDYMVSDFLPATRPHAAHIGIVLTDGDSQNKYKTTESALLARNAGFRMYAVGVGEVQEEELLRIAGDPQRVLFADSYRTLNTVKAALTDKTCAGINALIQEQRATFVSPYSGGETV